MPIKFKIKNLKLALLAIIFISFFSSLGLWQLSRAKEKEALIKVYSDRTLQTPLTNTALTVTSDTRFRQARLTGQFDNAHTFLLDNKIWQGKVGYEIYTPFHAVGVKQPILVDRGFIAMGQDRKNLPTIQAVTGEVTIVGLLNHPPAYVSLGAMSDSKKASWPMRIEFIELEQLSKIIRQPFFPYVLTLTPHQPGAYTVKWQVTLMPPEKHRGYALQWFAIAVTLVVLFVVLNLDRK